MKSWRPQPYLKTGNEAGIDPTILERAVSASKAVTKVDHRLPPVLTLKHLAHLTEVDFSVLGEIVGRHREQSYRAFHIRKKAARDGTRRYRVICVPEAALLRVQQWIAHRILAFGKPHKASTAYAKGNSILAAAEPHCGATWLIKLDIQNFFESISEIAVYRVFLGFGYQALPAFEMARLCTRLVYSPSRHLKRQWCANSSKYKISRYRSELLGHLPQGAPTSPMLANLAVTMLDQDISEIAQRWDLRYSRYADDITLSTQSDAFDKPKARQVIGEVYKAISKYGLSPNRTKAVVLGPGTRKIVLGLLVDGDSPRLNRDFKAKLRMHLYYLLHDKIGPAAHAKKRGFSSVIGLRNHLQGLMAYAGQIEPKYAQKCLEKFSLVTWPI